MNPSLDEILTLRSALVEAGAMYGKLRKENERLKELINNKQYIKLLADYNRGHLSHYNWLKEQDGGIRE